MSPSSSAVADAPATIAALAKPTKKRSSIAALEERMLQFASDVRMFVRRLPKRMAASEEIEQLLHASSSIGTTYIDASNAPTKSDFVLRIRHCLKEAKSTTFWLRLVDSGGSESLLEFRTALVKESQELTRIFFAILRKMKQKPA